MRRLLLITAALLALVAGPAAAQEDAQIDIVNGTTWCKLLSPNAATVAFAVSNSWSGTLSFKGSVSGITATTASSTLFPISALNLGTGTSATTTAANGNFIAAVAAYSRFCVSLSGSGSSTIAMRISPAYGGSVTGATGGTTNVAIQVPLPVTMTSTNILDPDITVTGNLQAVCTPGTNPCPALSTIAIPLAGMQSLAFTVTSSTAPVMTVVPECSSDGGTNWGWNFGSATSSIFFENYYGQFYTSLTNLAWGGLWSATNTYSLMGPESGVSHCRLRVHAYTSGSSTIQMRATFFAGNPEFVAVPGLYSNTPPSIAVVGGLSATSSPNPIGGTMNPLSLNMNGAARMQNCTDGRPTSTPIWITVRAGTPTSTAFAPVGGPIRFFCNGQTNYTITNANASSTLSTGTVGNVLPANAVEKVCTLPGDSWINFYAAATSTCTVGAITW